MLSDFVPLTPSASVTCTVKVSLIAALEMVPVMAPLSFQASGRWATRHSPVTR